MLPGEENDDGWRSPLVASVQLGLIVAAIVCGAIGDGDASDPLLPWWRCLETWGGALLNVGLRDGAVSPASRLRHGVSWGVGRFGVIAGAFVVHHCLQPAHELAEWIATKVAVGAFFAIRCAPVPGRSRTLLDQPCDRRESARHWATHGLNRNHSISRREHKRRMSLQFL